jgi:cytochrome P450
LPLFKNSENKQPIVKWVGDVYGETFNKTTVLFPSYTPMLVICDVEVMEALYTTHNAHFDKHPLAQNLTLNLTGKSILFDESTPSWKARRKAMAPAFYKGKLQGMFDTAKRAVRSYVVHLDSICNEGTATVDII